MTAKRLFLSRDYLARFSAFVTERGLEPAWLQRQQKDVLAADVAPDGFVSAQPFLELGGRIMEKLQNPALALSFGETLTLESHGFLGYAARASLTVRDALMMDVNFLSVRTNVFQFELHEQADLSCLRIHTAFDGTQYGQWLIELVIASLSATARQLFAAHEIRAVIHLLHDRPDYAQQYLRYGKHVFLFRQAFNGIFLPPEVLDAPLVSHDPVLRDLATGRLQAEMCALGADAVSVADQVRELLAAHLSQSPTVEQVANRLCMSPRTLKRRLAAEGHSFRELLNTYRCEEACRLLARGRLPVEQVAGQLGYERASNFSRAFRDWTGFTPRAYRRQVAQ